jgi:hypothetical protein
LLMFGLFDRRARAPEVEESNAAGAE